MNLVTIIENVEIERSNNKNLGLAFDSRLAQLEAQTDTEISTLEDLIEQKRRIKLEIATARAASRQEFTDRDSALAALIGGE